jgi:uncharacterized protein YodC (DUF2158 family)
MADENIVEGDTVMLKSGGPIMTVNSTGEYSSGGKYAECVWFNETIHTSAEFNVLTLKIVNPEDYNI